MYGVFPTFAGKEAPFFPRWISVLSLFSDRSRQKNKYRFRQKKQEISMKKTISFILAAVIAALCLSTFAIRTAFAVSADVSAPVAGGDLAPLPNRAALTDPATDLMIAGRTLIFDSTFSARYLLRKDVFDAYLADGMTVSSFTVTVNGEVRDLSGVIGSAETVTVEGVEYYWTKVTGIAAKDADTPFTFSLVCLYNGVTYTDNYTDSVKAALEKAAESGSAAFVSAANATLAYCAAAANAFGKDASAYSFDPVDPVTGVTEIVDFTEGSGVITFCGTSAVLKEELALRFWAAPGEYAGSIDDLTLKVNGVEVDAEREINGG
jgi:hypothetical protein